MSKKPNPYASEEDTRALLRKDTRTPAERKLDRMLEDRGASEQGAEPFLILRQIALEMLAEQPAQKRPQNCGTSYCSCIECVMEPAQQEPEFFTHSVEQSYDWSEWVCPDPKGYLMKCCDCGLVHEAEFGVVRYKSDTDRENCDMVDDPNLQAVFRMRRSEQWSPADMAHRAGGLTMEQPAQRTWVGLTDEEIDDLSRTMVKGNKSVNWLCQAIEAKLRSKNS